MKVHKDTSCGYSLFTHCSFDSNKNKHDYLRGENCKKNIFKEHTKNVKFEINIITQKKCRGPSHNISNLRYKIFLNKFLIQSKEQLQCLGYNMQNNIFFQH